MIIFEPRIGDIIIANVCICLGAEHKYEHVCAFVSYEGQGGGYMTSTGRWVDPDEIKYCIRTPWIFRKLYEREIELAYEADTVEYLDESVNTELKEISEKTYKIISVFIKKFLVRHPKFYKELSKLIKL